MFLMVRADLKGRPDRREGKKVSGGHFFSPWENPLAAERRRYACELLSILFADVGDSNPSAATSSKTGGFFDFYPQIWENPCASGGIQKGVDGCTY